MQGSLIIKNSVKILLCIFLLLVLVYGVQAAETYQFVTKWGTEGTGDGQFLGPEGVAIDSSGNIYVTDPQNNRVSKFTPDGKYILGWGSKGILNGQFNQSNGIAVDSTGNVYVTDRYNHRVQKFTPSGTFITAWGSFGTGSGQFNDPFAVAVDSSGNVYVTDHYNHRVQKFSPSGQFITAWGSFGNSDGQFNIPLGIAVDASDNVYVVDYYTYRIQKFTSSGQFITKWEGPAYTGEQGMKGFIGITVDPSGYVYVSELWGSHVYKFSPAGTLVTQFGTAGKGDGQFANPISDIAVDSRGNVYLVDRNNGRVQKFAPVTPITPTTTTIPVPATLTVTSNPTGADIFIDGVQRGTTPHTFTDIALGSHSVIVSKIGYLGKYSTITVSQGQPTKVDVTLEVLQPGTGTGTISVISDPPGAGIMLDGKSSGKATPYDFSGISSGGHTVEMTIVGYNSYTETVTVVPGTTVVVNHKFPSNVPPYIVVFVNSIPDGANVYIDDSYKGVTPTSLHLEKGTYILKLTKKDYVDDVSPLYVGSSGPITVTRTLNLPDPGFEGILAVISLVAVVLLVRRFR